MQAPSRLGPYDVIDTLGQGGMGAVYRGRHRELGVERAVKVLLGKRWDPQRFARFEREVKTLASLSHPNLVAIRELGLEEGRPWFAMDLIEGRSLSDVVAQRPPLDEALAVAAEAARGVGALHAAGIIHRDLKPSNVMLAADGRAVVIDMGLAVAPERDQRLTQSGAMLGTLGYMAPEQLYGAKGAVPQTDVYALGLILFELVTGTSSLPAAESQPELIGKILNEKRTPPSSVDASLPAALDRIVSRATAKAPEARYADGAALAEALEAARRKPGLSRRSRRGLGALLAALLLSPLPFVWDRLPSLKPASPLAPTAGRDPRDATIAKAERERLRIERSPDGRRRVQRAHAWLRTYDELPGVAGVDAVRARLKQDLRDAPLFTFQHKGDAYGCLLEPNHAVSLGEDGTVRVWSLASGEEAQRWACDGNPRALVAAPEPETVVVYRRPQELHWLKLGSPESVRVVQHPWKEPFSLAFTPDGEVLAAGGRSNYIHMLDVAKGTQLRDYGAHMGDVLGVGFAERGAKLLSVSAVTARSRGTFDNQIRAYARTAKGRPLVMSAPLVEAPICLAPAADQRFFYVGTDRGKILRCDLRATKVTGELERGSGPPHSGPVRSLAAATESPRLASVSGRELLLWDTEAEVLVRAITLSGPAHSLDMSADGSRVLVGGAGGRLELWVLD